MNPCPQNKPSRRTVLKSIGVTTTLAASGLLQSTIYAGPSKASCNEPETYLSGYFLPLEITPSSLNSRSLRSRTACS
ncbi:hypothetical protein Poly41_14910 [Novipirellula artificiosorum]|uniref:Uncharacterized protein n=1 Tax=Novipirellula artificiosorum TaxID=2528016 RepID=A0A5C6DXU0_9BACT|nr:hypothetical protein Poly41_14910 [Novipirellula artificiosorum]